MAVWKVIAIVVLLSLGVHLMLFGYLKRRIAAARQAAEKEANHKS